MLTKCNKNTEPEKTSFILKLELSIHLSMEISIA